MTKTWLLAASLAIMLSCATPFRRAKVPPPPGPLPARIPDETANTEPAPPPQNLPAPPAIPTPAMDASSATVIALPTVPTTPPKKAVRKQARRRPVAPPPAVEAAAKQEPAVDVTPAPAYQLGQVVSSSERESLQRQTEGMLAVCSRAISALEGRTPSPSQRELMNRIRVFMQQSKEAVDSDPTEARNLAARGKAFADALLADIK